MADYQLGGAYPPPDDVRVVARDSTDQPLTGAYSICYVNAFQTQPGANPSTTPVLRNAQGSLVRDEDWPDEYLLDIRTATARARVMREIVDPAIHRCASAGFQAVEADNLDSWTRSTGLLDRDDAIAMATLVIDAAHGRGLAIGQKNTAELLEVDLEFDFAVVEECQVWDECGEFAARYGPHVIEIEYEHRAFDDACADHGDDWSVVLRDLDVSPAGRPGYVFEAC